MIGGLMKIIGYFLVAFTVLALILVAFVLLCAQPVVKSVELYTENAYVTPRYNVVLGECVLTDMDSFKFKCRISDSTVLTADITVTEWLMFCDIIKNADRIHSIID